MFWAQLLDLQGRMRERILYHSGFTSKTLGPLRSLDFHNTALLLAAGTADCEVSVFEGCRPLE